LGPQLGLDGFGNTDGNASASEEVNDAFCVVAFGANHKIAAAAVFNATGLGNRCGDVNDGGQHTGDSGGLDLLEVVDAVLEGCDDGVGREEGSEGFCGCGVVGGCDAEEDDFSTSGGAKVGRGFS